MAADGEEASNPSPTSSTPTPLQLPPYPEMILEAIDALDNENGSNKTAISGYIKRKYGSSLPRLHVSLLAAHLARMKTTGELYFARNNYFRPDDDDDPSEPAPADTSCPRGQDPEPEDGVSEVPDGVRAPAPIVDTDAEVVRAPSHVVADGVPAPATAVAPDTDAVPVKRGRGRPPKPKTPVAKATDDAAAAPVVANDTDVVPIKRGRGRPPKPKNRVAEAIAVATSGMPRARGRPPKKAKVAEEAPIGSPAPATGNADDVNSVPVKHGRGRPPKVRP